MTNKILIPQLKHFTSGYHFVGGTNLLVSLFQGRHKLPCQYAESSCRAKQRVPPRLQPACGGIPERKRNKNGNRTQMFYLSMFQASSIFKASSKRTREATKPREAERVSLRALLSGDFPMWRTCSQASFNCAFLYGAFITD